MLLLTAGETYERMFGLDWQLLADSVLTLIAVFALLAIMSYFLFNPARKLLQDRRNKIQEELTEAAQDKEEAARVRAEYEKKLREIDKEAERILSDARKRALENESRIEAEAREEAGRILEKARREAELEKQKLADEVKKEMIGIAALMAGKAAAVSIDAGMQERLLDETLREIGESTWLS